MAKVETEKKVDESTIVEKATTLFGVEIKSPNKAEIERREKERATSDEAMERLRLNTYDDSVHLTEDAFDGKVNGKYKKAVFYDFKPGIAVYTKERYGSRFIAKSVSFPIPTLSAVQFNDLVHQGTAYIKK